MGVAVIVSAIHSYTLFNFDLFTNTQKMGLRGSFCCSHKCFFLFSLLSCPAILPPSSSCQLPLRKMLNLAGDSSARTVLPWPLGWLLARQSGSRALLGLQGDQVNTDEMTGLKPPAHIASLSGKDPQVFSCNPSGILFRRVKCSWAQSGHGACSGSLYGRRLTRIQSAVHTGGGLPAETLSYLSCTRGRSFVSIAENGDSI